MAFDYTHHKTSDLAVLVAVILPHTDNASITEFEELVESAGVQSICIIHAKRDVPDAKYFVGSGKAEEIKLACDTYSADVVIVNQSLTPSQARNLETLCGKRIVDRTGLILDIFAQRAQSFEGKLQVELAQLQHLSTRLIRMWTHLERQKGGIGLRGPGETQLESDRRLLGIRIQQIQKKLLKVESTRKQSRLARRKSHLPTITLVGYTNAGKSSLFNALTNADIYAADQLFATLDPTHRAITLPNTGKAILADTVGFIADLPHELIAAFKATLQTSSEADLLLEVIDCADPEKLKKIEEVETVLEEINAHCIDRIQVFNKIDLLPKVEPHIERNSEGKITTVWLSTLTHQGIPLLEQAIAEYFQHNHVKGQVIIPPNHAGKLRAKLYAIDAITEDSLDEEGNSCLSLFTDIWQIKQLIAHDDLAATYLTELVSTYDKFDK